MQNLEKSSIYQSGFNKNGDENMLTKYRGNIYILPWKICMFVHKNKYFRVQPYLDIFN